MSVTITGNAPLQEQQAYVDYRGPASSETEHLLVYQALAFVEKEHPALLVLESFEAGDEQVIDHPSADQGHPFLGTLSDEASPKFGCRQDAARLPRPQAFQGA